MNNEQQTEDLLNKLNKFARPFILGSAARTKPQRREIRTAIMKWWNDGNPTDTLDLSRCDPSLIQQIPANVIEILQTKDVSLRLPPGLDDKAIPQWLPTLKSLTYLELPEYNDQKIDLRKLTPSQPYDVVIGGNKIKSIIASNQADVFCHDVSETKTLKVRVYDQEKEEPENDDVLGRPYKASVYYGTVNKTNLNKEPLAKFDNDKEVACRHFAIQEMLDRQEYAQNPNKKNRFSVERFLKLMSKKHVAQNINPRTGDFYRELRDNSKENYIVGHSQWGEFIQNALKELDEKSAPENARKEKQFLVRPGGHSMVLRIRVKKTIWGRKRYVATFYDPNNTLTHVRIVEKNLDKVRGWNIDTFLHKDQIKRHYKKPVGKSECTHIIPVPDDMHTRFQSNKSLYDEDHAPHKTVKEFISTEKSNPGRFYHLLSMGLPLPDEARAELNTLNNDGLVKTLAFNPNSTGAPGINRALQAGYTRTIKEFGEIVLEARRNNRLTNEELFKLLDAKDGKDISGLRLASNKLPAAHEHAKTILKAFAENYLTVDDLTKLEPEPHWLSDKLKTEFKAAEICNLLQTKNLVHSAVSTAHSSRPSTPKNSLFPDIKKSLLGLIQNLNQLSPAPDLKLLNSHLKSIHDLLGSLDNVDEIERNHHLQKMKHSLEKISLTLHPPSLIRTSSSSLSHSLSQKSRKSI